MTNAPHQPVPANDEASTTVHWPADRFYWAWVETPSVTAAPNESGRQLDRLPEGLLDEVQGRIPEPLEELHAVAIPCRTDHTREPRAGLLVCAARITDLRTVHPSALVLSPSTVPTGFDRPDARVRERLNLLVSAFEPIARRRRRRLRHTIAALWLMVLTGLMLNGLHARAEQHERRANTARSATASLLAGTPACSASELTALVERTIGTNDQAQRIPPSLDATTALAAILATWPNPSGEPDSDASFVGPPDPTPPPRVEVQGLSVQHARASISAVVTGGTKDGRGVLAERVLGSFRAPAGWTLGEPRWTHLQHTTRLSFTLARSEPVDPVTRIREPTPVSARAGTLTTGLNGKVQP